MFVFVLVLVAERAVAGMAGKMCALDVLCIETNLTGSESQRLSDELHFAASAGVVIEPHGVHSGQHLMDRPHRVVLRYDLDGGAVHPAS